ncbi:uncharacterized protein si:ch1073-145m9.1 isoform X3 [Gadus macrocephalus]|uniref:uncharacterized protein si:ch1073-145m9.1 isoform X3 n=1 Tax=Gadus macrocephalus TaxID=80720 RepID=UPI0028CB957E|nr:uncharacterized protein si:ch1073-145m9.1 isoform X3 [Gadus macrocephalus]
MAESTTRRHVFVYWPNIIGVDGWVARRLEQTSRFGAWLDVVVDNLSRGMLWSMLFEWGWLVTAVEWCVFVCNHSARGADWKSSFTTSPYLVRSIMAKGKAFNVTFVCLTDNLNASTRSSFVFLCLQGFKTPLGAWVIIGIHCLPLWLYGHRWGLLSAPLGLPPLIQTLGTLGLTAGRLLGFVAEVWCIWVHIKHLIDDEIEKKS